MEGEGCASYERGAMHHVKGPYASCKGGSMHHTGDLCITWRGVYASYQFKLGGSKKKKKEKKTEKE